MSLTLHPYHLSMNIHKENSFCKRDINCKFLLLEIQAKQLWHWYWNIAGINTIYLSIFTLIYSPSIQYNEIIEGLSLGRNIRFNPGLLMVSKRGKERRKDINGLSLKKPRTQLPIITIRSLNLRVFLPELYLGVRKLGQETLLTNCPSQWPVRHHYPPPRLNSL